MMKRLFLFSLFSLPTLTLTLTRPVYAGLCFPGGTFYQCAETLVVPGLKRDYNQATPTGVVGTLISDILPIVLGLAGFITVIIIVISGIQFITSSGNPEAAGAARNRLIYAIIGFVVIILSFAILQIVNSIFLGTKIV